MQYLKSITDKYLKNITNNSFWIGLLFLVILLFGCDSVEVGAPKEEGIVDVPIALSVGGGWTVGLGDGPTRSEAYDEDELAGVTEAQIFVFRRPEGSADDVPFRYDPTNFMIIPLTTDLTGENGGKLNGEATLHKRPGFEYRVIAISYSSDRKTGYEEVIYTGTGIGMTFRLFTNDTQRFYIPIEPDMRIEDLKAKINLTKVKYEEGYWTYLFDGRAGNPTPTLSSNEERRHANALSDLLVDYPRLFYCDCYTNHNGSMSMVIPYSSGNNNQAETESGGKTNIEIKGELKIIMAKVVIEIKKIGSHHFRFEYQDYTKAINWLTLMSDNAVQEMLVSKPHEHNFDGEKVLSEKYTPICYREPVGSASLLLTTYLPPMMTHLALRVCCNMTQYEDYYLDNYLIRPEDDVVIDPETGEEIRNTYNDVFYLRPNHKYVIEVEDSEELLK